MNIILNGRAFFVRSATISYDDVCAVVSDKNPTVTYRLKNGHGGELTKGDKIAVSADLIINAVATGLT